MGERISAVLIVKNEEAVLGRCLRSVAGLGETVVMDTGSTDRTVEVAKSLGAMVFERPPQSPFHFAEARNEATGKAAGPWIFTIDADEVLRPGGIRKIRKAVEEAPPERTAFYVTFIDQPDMNAVQGAPVRTFPVRKVKLFRKDACIWKYRVHERIFDRETDRPVEVVPGRMGDLSAVSAEHLPQPDKSRRRAQNLDLLMLCVKENPEYTRAFRQLAQEFMLQEKWEEAIPYFFHYVEKTDEGPLDTSVAMERIGFCLGNTGRLEEALVWFERSAAADPRRREPLYWAAQYLVHAGQYVARASDKFEKAMAYLERAIAIPPDRRPNSPNDCGPAWGNESRRLLEGYRKSLEQMRAQEAATNP